MSTLVSLPDATTPDAFIKWANALPASNPPTWLGLAPNAEAALLATRGEDLLSRWQVRRGNMKLVAWVDGSAMDELEIIVQCQKFGFLFTMGFTRRRV